ncbi:MAG: hypothetical protein RR726_34955, partial [Pseudomonas sp.]
MARNHGEQHLCHPRCAGPAGAAVAIGLKRQGYSVRVVSEWRRFSAVEGISQRVLDGLRHAGLAQALA